VAAEAETVNTSSVALTVIQVVFVILWFLLQRRRASAAVNTHLDRTKGTAQSAVSLGTSFVRTASGSFSAPDRLWIERNKCI
jgi:hypothetical protein